ncbi:hypothetical protein D3C87_574370 [compost metagenome]
MIKLLDKINKKADDMGQANFNVVCGIIMTVVFIVPMFITGLSRWYDLYIK